MIRTIFEKCLHLFIISDYRLLFKKCKTFILYFKLFIENFNNKIL